MAVKMNKVILSCNLTKDPVFKTVGNDKLVAGLYVAHNDRKGNGNFFAVEAWDSAAKSCEKLKKGNPCILLGYLAQDRWQDGEGNNRQAVKIVASKILYVNRQVDLNSVMISCNVATDPEFKAVGNDGDKTVMDMRIACNPKQDVSYFFGVEAWNGLAKSCESLLKGSRIIVDGRLTQTQWQDDDGNNRQAVKIVAGDIHFVNKPISQDDGARHFD